MADDVIKRWAQGPLELGRRAATDIPLLPSNDHLKLVSLAALVGLLAGLAANLLRVMVRLCGAAFLKPSVLVALFRPGSQEQQMVMARLSNVTTDVLAVGALAAAACVVYGAYRDRVLARAQANRRTRAYLVAAVLSAAAATHWGLQVLTAVADTVHSGHASLLELFMRTPWWGLCAVALVGGALVGLVVHRFPIAAQTGVPTVIKAVALDAGRMPARQGPAYAGAAGLTVAAMGPVGLEAPVVVFGASAASGLGQALSLSQGRLRVLVAAGVAAGVSAAFNAPIAGALFALEIVVGELGMTVFSPVVIASVMGTVVHRSLEGDHPVLRDVQFEIGSSYEILLYVLLGLLCGGVATMFVRTLESTRQGAARALQPVPAWLRPGVGLLAVTAIALAFDRHDVLGSGYETLQRLLDAKLVGAAVLMIFMAKLVVTCLAQATGSVGGNFLPSLMLGAASGSMFGGVAHNVFGDRVAGTGAFALVGMGAVLSAVQQAPMTAVVMVFELCNDYSVILPLIVACILSTLVAARALGGSIYQRALADQGVVLARGKEQNVLRNVRVREAMQVDVVTIPEWTSLGALEQIVADTPTQAPFPSPIAMASSTAC